MKKSLAVRWAVVLGLIGAVAAAVFFLPVVQWLDAIVGWVRGFGAPGVAIYGFIYIAATVLIIPGTLLTAVAGLLYGVPLGVLIVSPASVLGATLAFLIGRYVARDWVAEKLRLHPKFAAFDAAIERNGFMVVLLMRLQPVFIPFALLNYALGITRVRVRDYILASWIGMFPASLLYVYFGSVAGNVTHLLHGDLRHNAWNQRLLWLGFAAAILLVLLLLRIARRALREQIAAFDAPPKSEQNQHRLGNPPSSRPA
jgi:uncharacterized membrane protein YdjX (TVP38/TMEM64 family)